MLALGLACENVAQFVGQPWTGLWLIFWVISNVSTAFYPINVEPRFYYWGYAWPLHQGVYLFHFVTVLISNTIYTVVEGTRCILFDLHNRLGLNFGVLLAWGAINTALFPISCAFMRWKTSKGIKEYWA